MKKVFALVLTLVLCLALCACGKSAAVKSFEGFMKQIETISLDSETAIVAAEQAYEALTEEEKATVTELYTSLVAKRGEYDTMATEAQLKAEQDARLANVTTLVDAIDASAQTDEAIVAAEEAYAALPEEEKAMIADVAAKLTTARATFDSAKVIAAIDAIGEVSLESKSAISTAKSLYNALSEEAKAMVTNYATFQSAEASFSTLWEAEKQRIIDEYSSKFDIEKDPVEGITWYTPDNMPTYIDTRCYIIPYIGFRNNTPWLCIRYNYTADDWIFWKKLTIMVDGTKYYKSISYYDAVRDNDTEVWEYYDECLNYSQAMDTEEIQMLKAIADSTETIIRFSGDEYHYDLYVSAKDKQMIRETLAMYKALLG